MTGLLLACAPTQAEMRYTPTTNATAVSTKQSDCAFDVLTVRPQRAIDELGIIDFVGGSIYRTGRRAGVAQSAGELKEKVAGEVCRAGGDAVIADVNGVGQYVRATIVRYRPAAQ